MLELEQQVAAEGQHSRPQRAGQLRQRLGAQPRVTAKKRQPHMGKDQRFQGPVRQTPAPEVNREQQPGGRIEQRGLYVPHEADPAILRRSPNGEPPLAQGQERVVEQREMKTLQVVRNMHAPEGRKIFQEEEASEKQRDRGHRENPGAPPNPWHDLWIGHAKPPACFSPPHAGTVRCGWPPRAPPVPACLRPRSRRRGPRPPAPDQ